MRYLRGTGNLRQADEEMKHVGIVGVGDTVSGRAAILPRAGHQVVGCELRPERLAHLNELCGAASVRAPWR